MRFLPVSYATILFAIHASAYSPLEDLEEDPHHDWREELGRDATADDYRQHGEPLPVVAPAVTSIRDEQSYIVKVDCLSCSSRVRNLWQLSEHIIWDVVEQETSFLFNFTIDNSANVLLLDGSRFFPSTKGPLPKVDAFQSPRNLSKEYMDMIVQMNMFEEFMYPYLEAKYPAYHLTYDKNTGYNWNDSMSMVNFTITAVEDVDYRWPGKFPIDTREQKIVSLGIQRGEDESLRIKRIEVLDLVPRSEKIGLQNPGERNPFHGWCGTSRIMESERLRSQKFWSWVLLGGFVLALGMLARKYRFVFGVRGSVKLRERKDEGFLVEKI